MNWIIKILSLIRYTNAPTATTIQLSKMKMDIYVPHAKVHLVPQQELFSKIWKKIDTKHSIGYLY